MALKFYNGSSYENITGSAAIAATNTSVTTGGVSTAGFTAPNLVDQATGARLFINAVSVQNWTVELLESGVVKASGTINVADMKVGFNYCRFTTPYTFATATASAYTVRVKSTSTNSGSLANATTNIFAMVTYGSATAPGVGDDVVVSGFHNAGMTTKSFAYSGTSGSWGAGTDTSMTSTTARTIGAALTIDNGASFVFDTTASTTLQVRGSIVVSAGGLFDMRGNASDMTKISTLIIDNNTSDGLFGLLTFAGAYGGQILTTGKTVNTYTTRGTGAGTAADPWIPGSAIDSVAGDEVVFGGSSSYQNNEKKFIKTRNSSTSFVLSDTVGGAESALANTHAAGSYVGLMTRNSVIKNTDTAKGFWIMNNANTTPASDFTYTRLEYMNCASGKGFQVNVAGTVATSIDGLVLFNNSAAARTSINLAGNVTQTVNEVILYNTRGTNYSAQSGLAFTNATNKTINYLLHFADPSSTTNCAALSLNSASNCTINHLHSYGANAANQSGGSAIQIFSSNVNTFNNCTVDAAKVQGVYTFGSVGNTFNNCTFGSTATNTIDNYFASSTYNTALYSGCTFGSATLISNYLNMLEGSEITFFEMDGNTSKHRWYNNHGSFWSSGSGLTETTVRTASSLALAIKPEDNSTGAFWEFLIPAVPSSQCGVFGYGYRNATFSSGTFKVELFLPGSTTADATSTFATTTGSWLPFNISAYYSGSTSRYATVRITAITSTAGAYAFIDDLYDAGTGNKVAGLDLWYKGKPSTIMVASDTSAIPAQVWGYSDQTTSANTMGQRQVDAADDAELAAIK